MTNGVHGAEWTSGKQLLLEIQPSHEVFDAVLAALATLAPPPSSCAADVDMVPLPLQAHDDPARSIQASRDWP